MTQTCLSHKQRLLVAGTLFGMFFGAGNLIFPVHLGQLAGRQFLPAAIGFILTAVGIPILGVAAIGSTHSEGLQDLSRRVGHRYSYFFTCLLYLTIGPFFAIPRCATTSFTAGIRPLLGTQLSEQTMLSFLPETHTMMYSPPISSATCFASWYVPYSLRIFPDCQRMIHICFLSFSSFKSKFFDPFFD